MIPDFKSYTDVTERLNTVKELIVLFDSLPIGDNQNYGISVEDKNAVIKNLTQRIITSGEAPTRESISQEMLEFKAMKQNLAMVEARLSAINKGIAINSDNE